MWAYAAAGVPAYWVVDPDEPSLTVLRLDGDRYVDAATVSGNEPFTATSPLAVTVVPGRLLDGPSERAVPAVDAENRSNLERGEGPTSWLM
jgi:hypothetical protein